MNRIRLLIVVFGACLLGACAHPMVISPDMGRIVADAQAAKIAKKAGFYIEDDKRALSVITPGGGGDSVSYQPYRDIETAFYKMLGNVFSDVIVLKGPKDADSIASHRIDYLVTPILVTGSSSPSVFTWPPTRFTVKLDCAITDVSGKTIVKRSVLGVGVAEFDEFKADTSLSGRRASEDALLKMQAELLGAPELRR